ncbi:AAEL011128-PA, partial [Aedes aegypti]
LKTLANAFRRVSIFVHFFSNKYVNIKRVFCRTSQTDLNDRIGHCPFAKISNSLGFIGLIMSVCVFVCDLLGRVKND